MFILGLNNALEYRSALFTWILVEIITLSSALFLWTGVFKTNQIVADYSYSNIILYYFLLPVVGAFTSVHISEKLPQKIKDGELSKDLVKPYSYLVGFVVNQLAIKSIQNTLKIPIYILVGSYLFIQFHLSLNPIHVILGLGACLCGYLIHVGLDITLSLFSFWFDDSWSLSLIKNVLLMIFGGLSFPIDMISSDWRTIYQFLPFDLIYYFPVSLMMGRLSISSASLYFVKWCFWILVCIIAIKLLWSQGAKKYSAYGQ